LVAKGERVIYNKYHIIYINGKEIDSKIKLSSLIKKIEKIELIKDDNFLIEEYYGIKYKKKKNS
jgi:hypothetical protein